MQSDRLFEMIYLLMERECITAAEFAGRFEVSVRTVYRDVESLSAAGIPVYMKKGKGGGISLLPDFVLDKTLLTEAEKEEVLSAMTAFKSLASREADAALGKLGSLLGEADGDWLEIDFSGWGSHEEEIENFERIKPAVIHKRVIRFLYYNNKKEESLRRVKPLKLAFRGQAWYLYAYCMTKNDYRFFKLKRMKNIEVTEESFRDEAMTAEKRHREQKTKDQRIYWKEKSVELTLRIASDQAFRVYDEFEDYEREADGSFLCRITMPEGDWMFSYLASFREKCEILAPESVKETVKQRLESWLEALE